MNRIVKLLVAIAVLLMLTACGGQPSSQPSQPQAAPAQPAGRSAAATPAPSSAKQVPSQAESSVPDAKLVNSEGPDSTNARRFADVTAWKVSFEAALRESGKVRTIKNGAETTEITEDKNNVSTGTIVLDIFFGAEGDELAWTGDGEASVTVDEHTVDKTIVGGEENVVMTTKVSGSGQTELSSVDPAAFLGINTAGGTYSVKMTPEMLQLPFTQDVTSFGKPRYTHSGKQGYKTAGGVVKNVPLPETGMKLSGQATMKDGTVLKWEAEPAS